MNVEDLLTEETIKYYSQGQDYVIRCLSPDHEDKHPSLRIDRVSGVFNCLSCGFKGNIFTHFGKKVSILDTKSAGIKKKIQKIRANMNLEMPQDARDFEHEYRSIKQETLLKYEAFNSDQLEDFEDRIIFPIRNLYGSIKAFCGRRTFSDADPKYRFYPKNAAVPLFPARPDKIINNSVILVEGIFDVLNLIDKGLPNALCAFGTNKLQKQENFQKIEYYEILGVDKIYIMFDGDEAGRIATGKTEAALKKHYAIETIELPEGRDPGSLDKDEIEYIKESLYGSSSNRKE
jgi:DNA primase